MYDENIFNKKMALPILYSLRHCPYAMRARIALLKSKQQVILRNITLTNKPEEMLTASPKGSVPILVISPSLVIEESLEIMLWALGENDGNDLLHNHYPTELPQLVRLIFQFDSEFTLFLAKYKCASRYREDNIMQCRQDCEFYIQALEKRLEKHTFLMSEKESLADLALLPFIRQFARVERQWYLQSPYPKLRAWLNAYLQSPSFTKIMIKPPLWEKDQKIIIFGE